MGCTGPMWNLCSPSALIASSVLAHGVNVVFLLDSQAFCQPSSAEIVPPFIWLCFKYCRLVLYFSPSPFLLLAFILPFVSSAVLFIYLHSLCALSQGCDQHLRAGNSLHYQVMVERDPIQRQGRISLKGKLHCPQLHVCTVQWTKASPFDTTLSLAGYDKIWNEE